MKRALVLIPLLTACDPAAAAMPDAGRDAPVPPAVDAGPPVAVRFADLPAGSEGIALGRDAAGDPVLIVGTRNSRLVHVHPDGSVTDFVTIGAPVGLTVRPDGETVLVCATDPTSGNPAILEVAVDGTIRTLVAAAPGGAPFGLTNYVLVAPDGSIVFSDSEGDQVYRADSDGSNVAAVGGSISYANGLAFSPDGDTLYVASWDTQTVHAIPFDATTGVYGTASIVHSGTNAIDGLVTTSDGTLVLITSTEGILLADPSMPTAAATPIAPSSLISLPANGVFGDTAFGPSELYVSALGVPRLFVVHTDLTAP